ncbi:MAG: anthranilate synthase component II [Syntrophothermus sp.]
MVLVIDNYDSFTYNLVQYLGELGAQVAVRRNDETSELEIEAMAPEGIVISPGPGKPREAGISNRIIEAFAGRIPILGVCLGHQCIGEIFGARVVRAREPVHGKVSLIRHDGRGLFSGLPDTFTATRYHSLVVDEATIPECLLVTARADTGEVMGIRHRDLAVEGVQFHPESILTMVGKQILQNFLGKAGRV